MKRRATSVSAPRGAPSGLTSVARAAIARTKASRAKLDSLISGVVLDGGPNELGAKRYRPTNDPG